MCSILLLSLVARCLETIDVYIYMASVVLTLWGMWEYLLCNSRC